MREEVQLNRSATQYGVVAIEFVRATLETQLSIKRNGRVDRATW
jgi:hypothetical protein